MQVAWAIDCPGSITGANLFLSLENEVNLKITSSLACSEKTFLSEKFIDAEVEIWKKGQKIGSFYSRRVTYSGKTQSLILNHSLLHEKSNIQDASQYLIDLKKQTIISAGQFYKF